MTRVNTPAIAVGAAAVLVVAIGAVLLSGPRPSVGVAPSVTPIPTPNAPPSAEPTGAASPTLAPISLGGQIAFHRNVDGNGDLYMMNLDRTGLVRLTDDPAFDWQPSWSPDGGTLFFSRKYTTDPETADLFSLDVASQELTRLTNLPGVEGDPHVSPDGTRIAFDQWPSEPGTYVMDIDGANPRLLFTPPDDTYFLLGWTGDGTGLYMSRGGATLLRLDVASRDLSTITSGGNELMRLSPDGTTFAFNEGGLSLMDADGSNVRQVAQISGSRSEDGVVSWSPDGAHVALAYSDRQDARGVDSGAYGWIFVVDVDSGEVTRWAQGSTELAWRPSP